MPQLHLYVPEEVAAEVVRRAQARGVSVSRYLAGLIQHQVRPAWPESYFEEVVGRWSGEPLMRAPDGELELRDSL